MKQQLTTKQYIECAGSKCPFCKSTQIQGESIEADGGETWQEIECLDCGAVWQDIYKLADISIIQEPTKKSLDKN